MIVVRQRVNVPCLLIVLLLLSGIDLDENRGGGTWMGMSRKGKIGVLLNVLQNELPDRRKRSRGNK